MRLSEPEPSYSEIPEALRIVSGFREEPKTSTPKEWITYLDVLTGLYPGHEIITFADDLVVLQMIPPKEALFSGINIARRYTPEFKSGHVVTYIKISISGQKPVRAAIMAGEHPGDEYKVRKVIFLDGKRRLCPPTSTTGELISLIDTALKESVLPQEHTQAHI
ncbi:MAG: hypothetical protein MUF85_02880 [Patescibacteria group bacterium]|jgi:hypothetical protein|nr:hypothetical protein [Patescibacteria group bacterium]